MAWSKVRRAGARSEPRPRPGTRHARYCTRVGPGLANAEAPPRPAGAVSRCTPAATWVGLGESGRTEHVVPEVEPMNPQAGVVLLAGLLLAGGAGDDAAKNELARLQGTWQTVSVEIDGQPLKEDFREDLMLIKGNMFT